MIQTKERGFRMRVQKGFSLFLVLIVMFIAIMAGCSGGSKKSETTASPSGAKTEATGELEPYTFSFYGNYDWMTTEPWGADPTSKWIQENLKITVEPVQSGGGAAAKLNTMIASDTLPDVMMIDRGGDVERLRAGGQLVALDEYLNKYPNLKQYAGDQTLNMLRSEDGKLYQFPNWYTSSGNGNTGWIINTKIYKELGSPKLETFDDLYDYLKKVKEAYPDVVPFETGIGGQGIDVMSSGFAENHPMKYMSSRFSSDGTQLTSIFLDPVFKETMLFVSKLFREKLITQDALTQKDDQVKEKLNTGRVAVFAFGDVANYGREGNNAWKAIDSEGGYQPIWPIHKAGLDKNQIFVSDYNSLGWNAIVITKSAKDPERIFAYLDWLTGPEGQRVAFFGPPGLYWDDYDANGAPVPNDNAKTTPQADKDKQKIGVFDWAGNTTFVNTSKAEYEMKLPEDQRNWTTEAQKNFFWKTSLDMTEFVNIEPMPDSEEGIARTMVNDIYITAFAKMLFAKDDSEVISLIEQAQKHAVDAGYDKLLQFYTEKWNENKAIIQK